MWKLIIWILFVLRMPPQVLTISDFFLKETNVIKERTFVDPKFSAPMMNVTVPVSRDAVLTCKVHDLYQYKVAFLKVDSQTILTISTHVITKNHRISITNTEKKIWQLKIRDVKTTDRGWYMCQINVDPMKSQMGYLNVVVPPDILDSQTSNDVIAQELENVTLSCTATGLPEPTIIWKREQHLKSTMSVENRDSYSFIGPVLHIPFITRHQAGVYLCIASNGIPPSVSKRLKVVVNFKPKIFAEQRVVSGSIGQKVTLECLTESFPNSVNYWMRANDDMTSRDYVLGGSYETTIDDGTYVMRMKLAVKLSGAADFGKYKCIAKNAIGYSEEIIQILPSKSADDEHSYQPTNFISTYLTTHKNDSTQNAKEDFERKYSIATVYLSNSSIIMVSPLALLIVLAFGVFAI